MPPTLVLGFDAQRAPSPLWLGDCLAIEIGLALVEIQPAEDGNYVKSNKEKVHSMLYTIAVVLIVLWLLGLVTSYTMGGFIHILLVVAVIMVLLNLINGRRSL